jgi:nucleoside-diphosphate-sugar epimerase
MGYVIFLAGASGAIGRPLVPLLCGADHQVIGTTRSEEKFASLRALGADPVAVHAGDAKGLSQVVRSVQPQIIIRQLTDLPMGLEPGRMAETIARNARIRDEGTHNLFTAAAAAGARRVVAQSIAWAYAPGPEPHRDSDPLDLGAVGSRAVSVRGIAALKHRTLNLPALTGVVLRYGQLYGPGTAPGIFNIVEPNDYVATEKAGAQLGRPLSSVAVGRTGRTGECRQAGPGQAVTAQQEGDGIFAPIGAGAGRGAARLVAQV